MVDIQSPTAEIRRGKKKERRRTNHSMKIYMVSLLHRATIKQYGHGLRKDQNDCVKGVDYEVEGIEHKTITNTL